MSVLHSPNSLCYLDHEWWREDIPEKLEENNPAAAAPRGEPLEWNGEFDHPLGVPQVIASPVKATWRPPPEPPKLTKFREELEELCHRLGLCDDIKKRALLYLPHLRPRMGERLVTCAAIVFLACIKAQAPRSLQEIAAASGTVTPHLRRRIKLIQTHMGEDKWTIKPEHLLSRYCAILELPFAVEKRARRNLRDKPSGRHDPAVQAASALLSAEPSLCPSLVQRMTGVSRTSLYNYK